MIALIWFAVLMTPHGSAVLPIQETTTFATMDECKVFGEKMKSRTADYARGLARLDWNAPIYVAFKCAPAGQPV